MRDYISDMVLRVPITYGCVACGIGCCTACAITLESIAYCRRCAATLLDTPAVRASGAFELV